MAEKKWITEVITPFIKAHLIAVWICILYVRCVCLFVWGMAFLSPIKADFVFEIVAWRPSNGSEANLRFGVRDLGVCGSKSYPLWECSHIPPMEEEDHFASYLYL